jgi:uncharacterized membrane protein
MPQNQNNPQNNAVNGNTFSNNPNVSDKHVGYVNQGVVPASQPQPQQQIQTRPNPTAAVQQPLPQQPVNNATPVQQQQFINPNNFQEVLGAKNVQYPEGSRPTPVQVRPQDLTQATETKIPQMPIQDYNNLKNPQPQQQSQSQPISNRNEVLKLVIYILPVIALFIQVFRTSNDKDVIWHTRQSLVIQGIWFTVMLVLTVMDAPIFSGILLTLWKFFGYGLLILAGANAYNGKRYQVPVAYDIGKSFIEEGL